MSTDLTKSEREQVAERVKELVEALAILAQTMEFSDAVRCLIQNGADAIYAMQSALDDAVAKLAARDAEVSAVRAGLNDLNSKLCARDAEVGRLRKDVDRWKFTMWWQDQNPRPAHIQDKLNDMHRMAHQRGALSPNSSELQQATDAAIAALSEEVKGGE